VSALIPDGLEEASRCLSEAEFLLHGCGDAMRNALERVSLRYFVACGDFERCDPIIEKIAEETRISGFSYLKAMTFADLAMVEFMRGRYAAALDISAEGVAAMGTMKDPWMWSLRSREHAVFLAVAGDMREAKQIAIEVVAFDASIDPGSYGTSLAIEVIAMIESIRGDFTKAATLSGFARAALERVGFLPRFVEIYVQERLDLLIRENLAPEILEKCLKVGARFSAEEAISLASGY